MQLTVLAVALLAAEPATPQCAEKKPVPAEAGLPPGLENAVRAPEPAVEPPDPDPFGFGTYQGRRAEPMQDAVINGARFQIASLILADSPEVVLQTYRAQLKKLGITPIEGSPPQGHGMRYLSFHPQGSSRLRTLTLLPEGQGTVVLVSVADPRPMMKQAKDGNLELPVPPGAGQVINTSFAVTRPDQRHAFFEVDGLSPSAVVAFYVEEMPKRGFKRLTDPAQVGVAIAFQRQGEVWTVAVTQGPAAGTARVELMKHPEEVAP